MSSSTKTGQKLRKRFKKELPFHLMLLPAVVMVVLFKYIPMAGLSIAFQDYSPLYSIFEQEWCGWENFKYIFSLSTFPRVIYNTLFIAIMKIAAGIIVPVTVALLLNEVRNIVYKRTLQTIVYLPHFISWVALAGIFLDVLGMDGIVNNFLAAIGLNRVYFLGNEKVFPFTMVVTDTWKTFGWNTIVYLAAITGISPALHDQCAESSYYRIVRPPNLAPRAPNKSYAHQSCLIYPKEIAVLLFPIHHNRFLRLQGL